MYIQFIFPEWLLQTSRFNCPNMCGRTYKRKQYVTRHLKYECGVIPQFDCSFCEKKFAHKETLKVHLMKIHKLITI